MGFTLYGICPILSGTATATAGRITTGKSKTMENLNFEADAILDPRDAEISELRQQLEHANRRDAFKADQLDQFNKAIMGVIGDSVEALAESVADKMVDDRIVETVTDCFDIYEHQSEIETMIDERLAERLGEEMTSDESREAIESQVREVLAGATVSLDI